MKKPITKETALSRLATLCGRSEQCEFDITRKLINWDLPTGDRKEIINYLIENKYIDNARYAKSFANDKARFSSWGPYKIRAELVKRKIGSADIKNALEQVDQDIWKEGLMRSANTKAKNLQLTGEEGREDCQKLFRYLVGRGFPSSNASKAVVLMKMWQEGNK